MIAELRQSSPVDPQGHLDARIERLQDRFLPMAVNPPFNRKQLSLQYAAAPPPAYPTAARRMHLEGTVLLEVLVDTNGRPLRVDVRQGSGHRQLDEAARDQVLARWRFQPAMRDGRAVQAIGLVPVTFTLR